MVSPISNADAGQRRETPMPSHFFPERSGDERAAMTPAIDEDVINLKRVRAAIVAGGLKPPTWLADFL